MSHRRVARLTDGWLASGGNDAPGASQPLLADHELTPGFPLTSGSQIEQGDHVCYTLFQNGARAGAVAS